MTKERENKKKNMRTRKKRRKGCKKRGLLVKFIKFILLIIVGILCFTYFVIKSIHTLIGKAFMYLPRSAKISIIYSLLICAGFGAFTTYVNLYAQPDQEILAFQNFDFESQEIKVTEAEYRPKPKPKPKTAEIVCKTYSNVECKIFKTVKAHGLSDNYGYMLMAISKHETGNWSSSIYKSYHNMGGIIGSHGFRQYNSLDEGIEDFVNLLDKYYINNGRTTIQSIGAKYCPVGASNDPTGLNNYWVPRVTKYYKEYISNN